MQRGHERSFWSYPCGHGRIHVYMSYTRSQSNFGSWDILHVKHFWRCIVSAVCVANQETSWIAAGAGARRAKTLNVLKGLFLHLSRHGHGMPPHVCVFDLLILCRPALMLNGGTCGHSQIRLARLDMEDMKKKQNVIWFFDMYDCNVCGCLFSTWLHLDRLIYWAWIANFNMIGLRHLQTVLAASQRPRATLWSTRTRECNFESAWTMNVHDLHIFTHVLELFYTFWYSWEYHLTYAVPIEINR